MQRQTPPTRVQSVGVFVYDTKSGKVVHFHQHVNLPGANARSEKDIVGDALRFAQAHPENGELELDTLFMPSHEVARLDSRTIYAVDPTTRAITKQDVVPLLGPRNSKR